MRVVEIHASDYLGLRTAAREGLVSRKETGRKIAVRKPTKEKQRPPEKVQENAGNTVGKWGGKVY